MNYGWVKNVCIIDSMHALLQYLLLVSEEEARQTFYFWGEGISVSVKQSFEGHYMNFDKKRKYSWFEILSKFPFLFRNNIQYWGHDHLPLSKYVIRTHDYQLLEDGLMNYNAYPWRYKTTLKRRVYALWQGPLSCLDIPYSGYEKNCIRIHLTGLVDSGEVYTSPKLLVQSFQNLWNKCNESKRNFINRVFGIDDKVCNQLKERKKILLTQPFSEDGFLSEEEKMTVYATILDVIGRDDVVIKRHPREKSDYRRFFPQVEVFDLSVPMQLVMLNDICFEEAYTIFSSAVFGFPQKIRIGFIGSQISQKLLNLFPNQTYKDCPCKQDNIELIDIKLEGLCC